MWVLAHFDLTANGLEASKCQTSWLAEHGPLCGQNTSCHFPGTAHTDGFPSQGFLDPF